MSAAAENIPEQPPDEGSGTVLPFKRIAERVVEGVDAAPSIGTGVQNPEDALKDVRVPADLLEALFRHTGDRGLEVESALLKDPYDGKLGVSITAVRSRGNDKTLYLAQVPGFVLDDPSRRNRFAHDALRAMFPPDSVLVVLSPDLPQGPHKTYRKVWEAWADAGGPTVYFVPSRDIADLKKGDYPAADVVETLHLTELPTPSAAAAPQVSEAPRPLRVFCSYAHDDNEYRMQLSAHLSSLRNENLIEPWTDRDISAGTEWESAIHENLEAADIILLLVSSSFTNSEYVNSDELRRALQLQEDNKARVVPIIVRPVDWTNQCFGKLQATPLDGKRVRPVTKWKNRDEAWATVAGALRVVVQELTPPA